MAQIAAQPPPELGVAANHLLHVARRIPALASLVEVLAHHPDLLSHPVVTPDLEAVVSALEREAFTSPFPPLHSLRAYHILAFPGPIGAHETAAVLAELQGLPGVELAYREPNVQNAAGATVTPGDETVYPGGGYPLHFDGGEWGINAASASVWGSGYDGTGIGFADLEGGWNLNHSDLPQPPPPVFNVNAPGLQQHGAAVLGVIIAQDNGKGVVGIAPRATLKKVLSHVKAASGPWPMSSWDIPEAILDGLSPGVLAYGDVLLIEIEARGPDTTTGYPIEIAPMWFDAIRLAAGNGVIVIEPAGNGDASAKGRDLDAWNGDWLAAPTYRTLKGADRASDSGAIMVSGCARAISPAHQHRHLPELNYGTRVNCYAWGEQVYTCGFGPITEAPDTVNEEYLSTFQLTSAASAIIAGAVILVQQMYVATAGRRLAPAQMRALLGDPTLGTIVVDAKDAPIGVMPDLAKIGLRLGAVPDVYVRDSVADAGDVPNSSVFQSPDIILRHAPSGDPDADFGENSPLANQVPPNDPVVVNADNYVYVRIRNRAAVPAPLVTATVYWSEASTLVAPIDWHLIGQINAGTVAAGGALHVAGPLHWHPGPGQAPASHGCFVAVLDQALDQAPPSLPAAVGNLTLGWTEFLDYVGDNNNVAWRNFTVLQAAPMTWQPMPFAIRGSWDEARDFSLELSASLPDGAVVEWDVPAAIAAAIERGSGRHVRHREASRGGVRLQLIGLGRLEVPHLRLEPRTHYDCTLHVRLPARACDAPVDRYEVVVRQLYQRICVGQVTWSVVAEAAG